MASTGIVATSMVARLMEREVTFDDFIAFAAEPGSFDIISRIVFEFRIVLRIFWIGRRFGLLTYNVASNQLFHCPTAVNNARVANTGSETGKMILKKMSYQLAPSIMAASTSSFGKLI